MPLTIPEHIEIKTAGGATAAFLSPEADGLKGCIVDRELNGKCTLDLALPLQKKIEGAGDQTAVFSRASVAYRQDGSQVASGVPRFEAGKHGLAVMVEEGTTNLLTANQSSIETDLTGLTPYNSGALTRITTDKWQGTACLQCVTPNAMANEGFFMPSFSVTASRTYTASVYLKGSGTVKLVLSERDAANVSIGTTFSSVIILTDSWQRVSVSRTFGASGVKAWMAVITDVQQGITFYADGLQFEQKSYPTTFIDGTRAAESLVIPSSAVNADEFTVEMWVKLNSQIFSSRSIPFMSNWNSWNAGAQKGFLFRLGFGDMRPQFVICDGVNYITLTSSVPISFDTWSHLVCVFKAGQRFEVYVNGVLGIAGTAPAQCVLDTVIYLGYTGINTGYLNGYIDDLRISNRARSDAEILAAYQGDRTLPVDEFTTYKLNFDGHLKPTVLTSKWQYLSNLYRIYAPDITGKIREFVIQNPDAIEKKREGGKLWGKVTAHESWVLLGRKYADPGISNDPQTPSPPALAVIILSGGSDLSGGLYAVGSAGHALYALLQGTGWTVGTVDVTGTHDLETEKESVLANVQKVQEIWGGYLIWDSVAKTVSLRDETLWAPYTGYQIRYRKNEKGIVRNDDTKVITKLYPFGENDLNIGSVNGGQIYIENYSYTTEELADTWINQDITDPQKLMDEATKYLATVCKPRHNYRAKHVDLRLKSGYQHEDYDLGHLTDLIDDELDIDDRARIIKYRFNVFQPQNPDLEVGDPIKKIEATLLESMQAAKYLDSIKTSNGQITAYKLVNESLIAEKIAKAAVDATKLNTKVVVLMGDTWTDYNPSGGSVSWDQHKLFYAGVEHVILAGNTSLKYIYWDGVANTYSASADMPTLTDGQFVIAMNNGGLHDSVWDKGYAREFIGSALIADAAILSAHIGLAQILDAHIANITANKITAGQLLADLVETVGKDGYFRIKGDGLRAYNNAGVLVGHLGYYETLAAQIAAFTRASVAYDDYGVQAASGVPRYQYMALPGPVWQDLFDTDQLAAEYTSGGDVAGTWAVSGGVLTGTGGTQATLIKKDLLLQDCEIEINCDQADQGGIIARYQDNYNYYLVRLGDDSSPLASTNVTLFKRVGGVFTQLGVADVSWTRGTPRKIKFSLHGSNLEVHFNSIKVISVVDTAFAGGGVGLRKSTSGTAFRVLDFKVYYVQKGLMVEEGTTNLLTANQASVETDLTGFSSSGSLGAVTLTRDTTEKYQGSASAKLVSNYAGVQTAWIYLASQTPVTPGQQYQWSPYLKAQTAYGRQIQAAIRWFDSGGVMINDSLTTHTVTSAWQRYSITATAPANAAKCDVFVYFVNCLQNEILWYDWGQTEQKAYATSGQLPGTARAAEILTVPASVFNKGNWTVKLKFTPTSVTNLGGQPKLLWNLFIDANNEYRIYIAPTGEIALYVCSGGTWYGVLGDIAAVGNAYQISGSSDGSKLRLFINGAQAGSDTTYVEPVGALPVNMFVGSWQSGGYQANGIISDFAVLNKAETLAEHQAAYNTGLPLTYDDATTYLMSCDGTLQPTVRGFGLWSKNGRFILQDPQTGQGIEVWDGAVRKIIFGRLDDGTIGGELSGCGIYSSDIRSGVKGATTFVGMDATGEFYTTVGGNTTLLIAATGDGNIHFYKSADGAEFGRIVRYNDSYPGMAVESVGTGLSLRSAGNIDTILGSGSNVFTAHGNFNATGGSKNCVEETSQGMVALSVRESPDIRYIDENRAMLVNGECKIDVDPLFMECTLPDSDETPWLIHLTPTSPEILYVSEIGDGYFIIKSSEQESSSTFFWKLSAVRKGYAGVRFQKFYGEGDVLTSNWEDLIIEELNANEEGI